MVCLCFFVLAAAGVAYSQGATQGRKNTRKPVVRKIDPQIAEAEKAWIPFWKSFTEAIRKRDKESLKTMISVDYDEGGEEMSDPREAFFTSGWEYIERDFLRKTWLNGRNRLSKIDKIESDSGFRIVRYWDSEFGEWGAYSFHYMPDGKWYLFDIEPGCTA